jgi:uncharacterized protein YqeY
VSDPVASPSLERRLRRALPPAMKARDRPAVAVLRTTIAAIENAGAVAATPAPLGSGEFAGATIGLGSGDAARRELTEDEVAAIVRAEIDERVAAAEDYTRTGRPDEATRLTAEADLLRSHLDAG